MVSFFFFLSFSFLGGRRGGGGWWGGEFDETMSRLIGSLMLRGGESTPTLLPIFSCDLTSFTLKLTGVLTPTKREWAHSLLLQRNCNQGTRKRSEKRASKGIWKWEELLSWLQKVSHITVVKFKSPGRNAAWRLVYFGGVRGDVSRAPSIKVFRSANIDRQNGCCELLKRYSVFIWCRWHGYSSQIGTF